MLPDDLQTLLLPVFAHRLLLSSEAQLAGRSGQDVLSRIMHATPIPGDSRTGRARSRARPSARPRARHGSR